MNYPVEASASTVGLFETTNQLLNRLAEGNPDAALTLCYSVIANASKNKFNKSGLEKDVIGNPSLRRIHGKIDITGLDPSHLTKLFSVAPEIFFYYNKPAFHVSHPVATDINLDTIETLKNFCAKNELGFLMSPNDWVEPGVRIRLSIFRPEMLDLFNLQSDTETKE